MPPAVLIGAALAGAAAVGAAAIAGTAITLATFLVPAAISLGVGLIARALAPKPPSLQLAGSSASSDGDRAAQERRISETIYPARYVLGKARVQGRLIWLQDDDRDLHLALALSEDPCTLAQTHPCLLYTSPSPRDRQKSRMPSSA